MENVKAKTHSPVHGSEQRVEEKMDWDARQKVQPLRLATAGEIWNGMHCLVYVELSESKRGVT